MTINRSAVTCLDFCSDELCCSALPGKTFIIYVNLAAAVAERTQWVYRTRRLLSCMLSYVRFYIQNRATGNHRGMCKCHILTLRLLKPRNITGNFRISEVYENTLQLLMDYREKHWCRTSGLFFFFVCGRYEILRALIYILNKAAPNVTSC